MLDPSSQNLLSHSDLLSGSCEYEIINEYNMPESSNQSIPLNISLAGGMLLASSAALDGLLEAGGVGSTLCG